METGSTSGRQFPHELANLAARLAVFLPVRPDHRGMGAELSAWNMGMAERTP